MLKDFHSSCDRARPQDCEFWWSGRLLLGDGDHHAAIESGSDVDIRFLALAKALRSSGS